MTEAQMVSPGSGQVLATDVDVPRRGLAVTLAVAC
jgi:hypothetical protein